MKNFIQLIILAGLLVTNGCKKDFLDLTDPTKKAAAKFYHNEQEIRQAVNGAYSSLQNHVSSLYVYTEMPTDNTTIQLDPSDRGQTDRVEAFEFWNVTPTNVNIADLYNQSYNALYNINTAIAKIDGVPDISEDKKQQYTGELAFMRAYYYFDLVRLFGPVVLMTEPLENASDAFDTERAPETDVYAQIIKDLEAAVASLPEKSAYPAADKGRASKGAALGLLGKVYLTTKDYAKATSTLKQILKLGYSLVDNYAAVFDPTNKNNSESLFEVQFQGGNNLGEYSNFIYQFAPRGSEGAVTGFSTSRPMGWNIPTRSIITAFEPDDKRKDVSLKMGYTNGDGEFIPIPYINKYNHPHTIEGRTDDNWPILRYSDVLLMLAESINEVDGPANAYSYINQVRHRAGLKDLTGLNKESFRAAIRHERRVELAFENDRWFDLKRAYTPAEMASILNAHGKAERENPSVTRSGIPFAANDYKFDVHEALYPIPDRQRFLDPHLTQNPGY